MFRKIKGFFRLLKKKFLVAGRYNVNEYEISERKINIKIKSKLGTGLNFIDEKQYKNYFEFFNQLGLKRNFQIITSLGNLILFGSHIKPIIINKNNNKIIIFCHGITNNRWSLFYCIHLFLQLGYQVIIYDARGHGLSDPSEVSLGKEEAEDLEDIIKWTKKNCQLEKIGLYGFSMGASTIIFWLNKYQNLHSEIKICICESVFDRFSRNLKFAIGSDNPDDLRFKAFKYLIDINVGKKLHEINPILVMPPSLRVNLLLLHGMNDRAINWKSSYNIWEQSKKKKINAYFFREADHGEVPFMGDALPGNIYWAKGKNKIHQSRFKTFSELLVAFLEKNF